MRNNSVYLGRTRVAVLTIMPSLLSIYYVANDENKIEHFLNHRVGPFSACTYENAMGKTRCDVCNSSLSLSTSASTASRPATFRPLTSASASNRPSSTTRLTITLISRFEHWSQTKLGQDCTSMVDLSGTPVLLKFWHGFGYWFFFEASGHWRILSLS